MLVKLYFIKCKEKLLLTDSLGSGSDHNMAGLLAGSEDESLHPVHQEVSGTTEPLFLCLRAAAQLLAH